MCWHNPLIPSRLLGVASNQFHLPSLLSHPLSVTSVLMLSSHILPTLQSIYCPGGCHIKIHAWMSFIQYPNNLPGQRESPSFALWSVHISNEFIVMFHPKVLIWTFWDPNNFCNFLFQILVQFEFFPQFRHNRTNKMLITWSLTYWNVRGMIERFEANNNNSIKFNSVLFICWVNSCKANYRHSTVYM
jgi:hypothetical protein